jgi:hypothetical protein
MPIVGGLGIHRKQITFGYPGTVTGEIKRGQIAPADRAHLRPTLRCGPGRKHSAADPLRPARAGSRACRPRSRSRWWAIVDRTAVGDGVQDGRRRL